MCDFRGQRTEFTNTRSRSAPLLACPHAPLSDPVYPDDIGILGFSQFSAAGFQCDGGEVKCGGCNNSFKAGGIGLHFRRQPQCWELAKECRRTQMRAVIEFWDKF